VSVSTNIFPVALPPNGRTGACGVAACCADALVDTIEAATDATPAAPKVKDEDFRKSRRVSEAPCCDCWV
jgi:hypothetical protein